MEMEKFYVAPEWKFWRLLWKRGSVRAWRKATAISVVTRGERLD